MTYTITPNAAFGSLEISFDSVPSAAVRAELKNRRFRWHTLKKIWYGYADENALRESLDKLVNRAERIAAANRERSAAKTARVPVVPSPENPAPETPFPSRDKLEDLKFRYRAGNATGSAAFTVSFLETASASALKTISGMIDGIEDAEERKQALFTLAAVAYYTAVSDPAKKSRFRSLAALYAEKTGVTFPAPAEENDRPASPASVTAAMKRVYSKMPEKWEGVFNADGSAAVCNGCQAIFLRSSAPDLPAAKDPDGSSGANLAKFVKSLEDAGHTDTLPLPSVKSLKTWLKCYDTKKSHDAVYDLDGIHVNARYLLNMLEALPGATAYRPANLYEGILFTAGEDRGILMQVKGEATAAPAEKVA